MLESSEIAERSWQYGKVAQVLLEEHKQYIRRDRTADDFLRSLREGIAVKVGALDRYGEQVKKAICFIGENYSKKINPDSA